MTVDRLRRAGMTVGVCTGRSRLAAQALLRSSGLGVTLLAAREDAMRPKPAPDGLRYALDVAGVPALAALYVGDTDADVEQGTAAGVPTVLVGGRPAAPGARVIASLDGLLSMIEEVG